MAVLAGSELMSERLAVGLDSGDQEDEHSCFSDTTHQDFVYDVKGIENVWNGTYPGGSGPGIEALVASVDPALAAEVERAPRRRDGQGRRPRRSRGTRCSRRPEGSPGREAGEAGGAGAQRTRRRLQEGRRRSSGCWCKFPPAEQWTGR